MKKVRADQLAADQGLAESREKAKRLIMAGQILLDRNGAVAPVAKPGQQLSPETILQLKTPEQFVSRGAYKLLSALEQFAMAPTGWICLDAGASTGGFTDCLLQHGAAKVYAVDVGSSQLHEKLQRDERVISLEGVNLRYAAPDLLPCRVDLVTADLSFISLTLVLPALAQFLKPDGRALVLVKPQFELGPEKVRKGVVRSSEHQQEAVDKVLRFAVDELGLACRGVTPAGVKGPKGNQEYVAYLAQARLGGDQTA